MASLIESTRWRDGGSISAIVRDGQQHRAFWLQMNRWDHPRESRHENLFVSDGDDPESKQKMIAVASADERQCLDYLLRVDVSAAGTESQEAFQAMRQVLQARQKDSQ
jgi:hypothetical protein